MKKVKEAVTGLRTFLDEVRVELKKCAWPTREELLESTVVVIISVALLATYVAVSDGLVMTLLKAVIR
jgi:preprotein translocase subunit SecE